MSFRPLRPRENEGGRATSNLAVSRRETVEETFQKLQRVTMQIQTSLRAVLAEEGVTLGGLILLQILIRRGVPMTPTELADYMMVTNGAITSFMDRLEAEGLITRIRMPLDRRLVLVEATKKAKARFENLRLVATSELAQTFHELTSNEMGQLGDFLNRLMIRSEETRSRWRKNNGTLD